MAPRPPRQVSNSSLAGAGLIPGLGFCFNKFLHSLPRAVGSWQAPHRHRAGSSVLGQGRQGGGKPHSPVPQAGPGCGELLQAVPGLGHKQQLLEHEEFCSPLYIQE